MSSLTTLARPYAKAAFELAQDKGDLAVWGNTLAVAAEVVSDNTIETWLNSPEQDGTAAIQIIEAACGGELDDSFRRYLDVLADNNRLGLLPEITTMYSQLREAAENRLSVQVVSAVALDDDQSGRMSAALAKRFNCEIELHNTVDSAVLGGAVIYAGDEVIDGSLVGRLDKLQSSLA